MTAPIVAVSKPVTFAVTTVNSGWSWRCERPNCGLTRNGLCFDEFASSMRAHVAQYHATFTFGIPRTV